MNTDPNKADKLNEARNLYFQTSLTQTQIAELIGISQKTVSVYIRENKWDILKHRAKQVPAVCLEQMNSELQELNETIASRPIGQRFPTLQEANIRLRIMASMATIRDKQATSIHIEVLSNFIQSVTYKNPAHAQIIVKYADDYLKGEMKMSKEPQFSPYQLPGEIPNAGHANPDSETNVDNNNIAA